MGLPSTFRLAAAGKIEFFLQALAVQALSYEHHAAVMGAVRGMDIKLPGGELHQPRLAVDGHEPLGAEHLRIEVMEKLFHRFPADIRAAAENQGIELDMPVLVVVIMGVITMVRPLRKPVVMPVRKTIDMRTSPAVKWCGAAVIAAVVGFFIIFW